jgi:hypothetical protein
MKKTITSLFLLIVFATISLTAQIPNTSPIPVEFRISGGLNAVYDYSSMADFGDTLVQTVSGPLVWAYGSDTLGNQTDSLLCKPAFNDLTGKIALVRRGTCNFSLKIWHAQEAGALGVIIVNHTYNADGGGLVNMAGGDSAALVHTPAIFITRDDGDKILSVLDAGGDITSTFEVRSFGSPLHAYSHQTPASGILPLEDIGVTYVNTDLTTTIPSVTFSVEITDPNAQKTTLSQTLTDIPPLSINQVTFEDSYTPTVPGEYSVVYSSSINAETIDRNFIISEYTYAQDDGNIIPSLAGTIEPDTGTFVNTYNWNYDFGNFFRTGSEEQTATFATFIVGNIEEIRTGFPDQDLFRVALYDADPDGNGTVPAAASPTYDGLDESGGLVSPIGYAEYSIEPDLQSFNHITVEFEDPVTLIPNHIYLLMVQYNGELAGLGIPPHYAFGGTEPVAGGLVSAVFTDSLYTGGWSGGYRAAVRLHLDGFVGTKDVESLDPTKISVQPIPTSDYVNLKLDLEKPADEVNVAILDFQGRIVRTIQYEDVHHDIYNIDVRQLPVGSYFLSVITPEGFRSKKFSIVR